MKCHQYYPDSGSLSFGPITVTLIDSMPLADFTIRILKLEMVSSYFAVSHYPSLPYTTDLLPHILRVFSESLPCFKAKDSIRCSFKCLAFFKPVCPECFQG